MDLFERFNEKYIPVPESGCWIWLGHLKDGGYGSFYLNGKPVNAHRASYLIHKGNIKAGNVIRHTCDTRCCVNPDHLLSGTQKENMRDMVIRDRQNIPDRKGKNNAMYGKRHSLRTKQKLSELKQDIYKYEKHPRATITMAIAKKIRAMKSEKTAKEIADELNVSWHVVRNVLYNKSWRI